MNLRTKGYARKRIEQMAERNCSTWGMVSLVSNHSCFRVGDLGMGIRNYFKCLDVYFFSRSGIGVCV